MPVRVASSAKNSPIRYTSSGTVATFKFLYPGTYGFFSEYPYADGMKGAVFVVP